MRTAPTASGAAADGASARAVPVVPHNSAAMSTMAIARPCRTAASLESLRARHRGCPVDAAAADGPDLPRSGRRPDPGIVHDRTHRVGSHWRRAGGDRGAAPVVYVPG